MTQNQLQYDANRISARNADTNARNAISNERQAAAAEMNARTNKWKAEQDNARQWTFFWV